MYGPDVTSLYGDKNEGKEDKSPDKRRKRSDPYAPHTIDVRMTRNESENLNGYLHDTS
jgi:hypothetical protein